MKLLNYDDPEVINEINSFLNSHYEFKDFHDFYLNDGTVQLII